MAGTREWEGGAYEGREGIRVTADAGGITIEAFYDGGISLEIDARLTWAEVDALRTEA